MAVVRKGFGPTLSDALLRSSLVEMAPNDVLAALITGLAYAFAAALLAAIVFANLYAILHAWRSDRSLVCRPGRPLLTGGGFATAVYLFVHYDEPMPPAGSRRHALA